MFLFRDFKLSETKELRSTLKVVYGLGWFKAHKIADSLGFRFPYSCNNLNVHYIWLLVNLMKHYVVSFARIKKKVENHINILLTTQSYRGWRHKLSLPVRGQRTRTNSATQRRKRMQANAEES